MATTIGSTTPWSKLQTLSQRCRQALATPADLTRINVTRWSLIGLMVITGASLSLLSVKAFEVLVTPPSNAQEASMTPAVTLAADQLRQSGLFNGPAQNKPAAQTQPLTTPSLVWQLQGVFTGAEKTSGSAILSNTKQPARLLHAQQVLPDGSKLVEVHNNRVLLQQTDGRFVVVRFPAQSTDALSRQVATNTANRQLAPSATAPKQSSLSNSSKEERRMMVRKRLQTLRERSRDSST